MPDRRIQMTAEIPNVPSTLEESALTGRNSSFRREKAAVVLASTVMFEEMLTGWASDWLRLLARRLDRPVTEGRTVMEGLELPSTSSSSGITQENRASQFLTPESIETIGMNPPKPIRAQTYHRRSTMDRIRRRMS